MNQVLFLFDFLANFVVLDKSGNKVVAGVCCNGINCGEEGD